jgi:TonB family protein
MLGFLASVAAIVSAAQEISPPQLLNKQGMFSADDYPIGAVLLEQEGTAVVSLDVDDRGRVTSCAIQQSSGSAMLDSATCRIFQKRAKFAPARDASGRAIATDYTSSKIVWRVAGSVLPVAPWTVRALAIVLPNSTMGDCGVDGGGAFRNHPKGIVACSEMQGGFTVTPELLKKVAGRRTLLVFDKQFVPTVVNSINTPPDLRSYTFLGREVVNVKIGPDGLVTSCLRRSTEGAFPPVVGACESLRRRQFSAPLDKNRLPTSIWGTATMSLYSDP